MVVRANAVLEHSPEELERECWEFVLGESGDDGAPGS